MSELGTIYFIGAYDQSGALQAVKIGYTGGEVDERRKALQTGNENELKVICQCAGTTHGEAWLHRKLELHRLEGEWFDITERRCFEIALKFADDQHLQAQERATELARQLRDVDHAIGMWLADRGDLLTAGDSPPM